MEDINEASEGVKKFRSIEESKEHDVAIFFYNKRNYIQIYKGIDCNGYGSAINISHILEDRKPPEADVAKKEPAFVDLDNPGY